MPAPLLIEDLVKNYGDFTAVDKVSLETHEGEIFGLLGPNGAGKTTIISTIVTLQKPTSGKVKVFGHDVTEDIKQAKMVTGYVPQELVHHGYFTIEEIMQFHSGYYGILRNKSRTEYLLKTMGLWEHRKKIVRQLSGGMKRRLLIAKSLVHNPKLLLLDEPTAGVDSELRQHLWDFVRELKSQGMSIVLTTHYLEEAELMCDRVGIIHKGVLREIGKTQSLIKKLTTREIYFSLEDLHGDLRHKYLVHQEARRFVFRVPAEMSLSDLLSEINLDLNHLKDLKIREGNLEDAFLNVIGKD